MSREERRGREEKGERRGVEGKGGRKEYLDVLRDLEALLGDASKVGGGLKDDLLDRGTQNLLALLHKVLWKKRKGEADEEDEKEADEQVEEGGG